MSGDEKGEQIDDEYKIKLSEEKKERSNYNNDDNDIFDWYRKNTKSILIVSGSLLLILSMFFLSSDLTGFAIGSLSQKSLNWIGIIFLVLGLIGAYIWSRS